MRGTVAKKLRRLCFHRDRNLLNAAVKVLGRRLQTVTNTIELYRLAKKNWGKIKYDVPKGRYVCEQR